MEPVPTSTRRPRGRPALPPEQRRHRKIEVRCTDSDRELFEQLLAQTGKTEAELLLDLVYERAGVDRAA